MRHTRFALLLLVVGWACFPFALVVGSLAPAFLGVLLIALVEGRARPTVSPEVSRDVPARVTAAEPFTVVVRARNATGELPLFVEDELPPGVRVLSSTTDAALGRVERRLEVVADDPGVQVWGAVRVRFQDAWGLLEDEVRVPVASVTEVRPEPALLARGRRVGKSVDLSQRAKRSTGLDWEPEIERLRDYQAGDRLRDVDWAHTAQLGKLITREMRRETLLPVIILLQATSSMRPRVGQSKLATCARAALATIAAAQSRHLATGLVAWSERGVEAQVRPAMGQRALTSAMLRLGALPADPIAAPPRASEPSSAPATPSAEERAFLEATGAFLGTRGAATPLEDALATLSRVASQPSLVVAFVDGEEDPRLVQALSERLRTHGHRAVFVVPACGAHRYRKRDVDENAINVLLRWRTNREVAATNARKHGFSLLPLPPRVDETAIREVVASAR